MASPYAEEDLVVAVWANPKKQKSRPNARLLETMTSDKSLNPVAFPLSILKQIDSWKDFPVALSSADIDLLTTPELSSRENPVLIPLTLAKSYLGWHSFYIPTAYEEKK